jgi:site-specific DNA recombinase
LPDDDRDLLERHLERVKLTPNHVELGLWQSVEAAQAHNPANNDSSAPRTANVTTISLPWTSPVPATVKGIAHVPAHNTPITPSLRDALLMAIARARRWADELARGGVVSFAMLARRERKLERHIRLLLPLAFLSPRIGRLGLPLQHGLGDVIAVAGTALVGVGWAHAVAALIKDAAGQQRGEPRSR